MTTSRGPRLGARGRDRAIAALLALGAIAWLLAVEGRQGFGRDEAQYFRASERYWGWFEELAANVGAGHWRRSFTPAGLDHYWGDNAPDHPVIMKTLYGLSWRAFHRCTCTGIARGLHPIPVRGKHRTLPLFRRESTAFRFPAILMAGLLVALVYRFARRFVAWPAAAAGAVLTLAQPHYFFHAQIACFDAPITTMAFAVGYAYWKSLRSARWGILCGLVFGIALGTKHNAWLMPFFLAGHYLWMRRGDLLTRGARRFPRVPLAFVSMAVLGPIVFLLHWPWLWQAPVTRTHAYLARHLNHEHYNFEYLGRNWNLPPTSLGLKLLRATAPFVETGFTVPVTTLVLALVGAIVLWRRRRGEPVTPEGEAEAPVAARPDWTRPGADVDRAPGAFIAVQVFGPLAVVALPSTPVFGGVKHFMPAMPYVALAAAVGLSALARALVTAVAAARPRAARALPFVLAAWVCVPAVVETRRSHPDGLSHYNLLAGGFAGGASLGMNRQFWAYCVLPMLPWVDSRVPENRAMYWHDVLGDALVMYKREGRLGMGVGDTGFGQPGIQRSSMGLLVHEKHWAMYEGWLWDEYGTTRPTFVREREGVPLVTAYERGAAAMKLPRFLEGGWRSAVVLYVVFTGAYLGASGGRLVAHSAYNHYVYLADGWLHGRLALVGQPPNENDWAKVDVLKLKDGRELRGLYGSRTGGATDRFYPLRGQPVTIPESEIASRSAIRYVSFPPFPAVLMLPFVAISGLRFNDVLFTALWAGLNPVLLFLLLRDLARRGLSKRKPADDLWLTVMFGVGSVYYFCSVLGQVWFTALVVCVTLSIGYAWASLDAERPFLAGLFVALGCATRGPWVVVPLFLLEAVRVSGGWSALRTADGWRALAPRLVRFAVPIALVGGILCWHNYARFQQPFEYGHKYLNVQWQERIMRFGLLNYHFLSRNLAAALVLLPRVLAHYPYVRISHHGMSLLVTSPNLAYTVMPQERTHLTKPLWLTILTAALPGLLYQNSGYIQFGYRFSLDYMIFFMLLLAIGNRPITRVFKGLVIVAFAINLFLAITFDRYMQFSYDDSFFPHGQN